MQMQTIDITTKDLLQNKLEILRKNKENIPVEDQKGKYAKAFEKLEKEISALVYQMMKEECFYWWCRPENKVEARNYFVELLQQSGINDALSNYDAEACLNELIIIKDKVMEILIRKNDLTYSSERCSIDPFNPQKMIETVNGYTITSDKIM